MLQWSRQFSIEVRLLAVMFALFLLAAWLGQKFEIIFFHKLALPLLIFSACLFIWLFVQGMNLNRRLIGIIAIIVLLTSLFKNTTLAHYVIVTASWPLLLLMGLEFTKASRSNIKACLAWMLMAPLFGTGLMSWIIPENWWIPLLAFPITWIGMALYADPNIFQKSLKLFSVGATLLLVCVIIFVDVLALDPVLQLINNKELSATFNKILDGDGLPAIQLLIVGVYLPLIIVTAISYFINKQRLVTPIEI